MSDDTLEGLRDRLLQQAALLNERYASLADRTFPVRMNWLASLAGIKVKEKYMPDGRSGQLLSTEDGLVAWINIFDAPARQNFTIAHEIAHTFFPDYREVEYRSALAADVPRSEEERLCDEIASELLMPAEAFRRKQAELPRSLAALPRLARYFGASFEAVAWKMAMLDPDCSAIVALSDYGSRRKLTVKKVFPSASWNMYIPARLPWPPHTPVADSFYRNTPARERTDIKLGPLAGRFDVETLPGKFRSGGKLYVAGFVRLSGQSPG